MGKVNKALGKKEPAQKKAAVLKTKAKPKGVAKPKMNKTVGSPVKTTPKKQKKIQAPTTPTSPMPRGPKGKLDDKQVKSGIKALRAVLDKQSKEKKELFDAEAQNILLQIGIIKIPKCPARVVHFPLPHTLLTDDSEICLITADIKENAKEHEKTVKHYEDLLKKSGVTVKINKIIPFRQLKEEHSQFESQRRFVQLYDFFLVERKVEGYVFKFCGAQLKKQRKNMVHISFDTKNLDDVIRKELKKVQMRIHSQGNSYTVDIANTKMTDEQILENLHAAFDGLEDVLPGGTANIKNLHIKTGTSMAVPIYISLKQNSEVDVPVVQSQRPKAHKVVKGELSTKNDSEVVVFPTGEVQVKSAKGPKSPSAPAKKKKNQIAKKKQKVALVKEQTEVESDDAMNGNDDGDDDDDEEDVNVSVQENGVKTQAKKAQNGVQKNAKKAAPKRKAAAALGEKSGAAKKKPIIKAEAKKVTNKKNIKKGKAK